MSHPPRESDRWITPRVVVAMIFAGLVLVLAFLAAVTYLQLRGLDPDPMLRLMGDVVIAVSAFGGFLLQLANRRTTAKTERNTGTTPAKIEELSRNTRDLAEATWEVLHEIPARHPQTEAYPVNRPPPAAGRGATPPADGR